MKLLNFHLNLENMLLTASNVIKHVTILAGFLTMVIKPGVGRWLMASVEYADVIGQSIKIMDLDGAQKQ